MTDQQAFWVSGLSTMMVTGLTRFSPDSELSRLNTRAGLGPVPVSS